MGILGFVFNVDSFLLFTRELFVWEGTIEMTQDHLWDLLPCCSAFWWVEQQPYCPPIRPCITCSDHECQSLYQILWKCELHSTGWHIHAVNLFLCILWLWGNIRGWGSAVLRLLFDALKSIIDGILMYIFGWVVRKVAPKVECKNALIAPAHHSSGLLRIKNNGGLCVPSESLCNVVKVWEAKFVPLPLLPALLVPNGEKISLHVISDCHSSNLLFF